MVKGDAGTTPVLCISARPSGDKASQAVTQHITSKENFLGNL
jgi:hypothetical protein